MGFDLQKRMTLQSRGLARSRDKLKPLYLHYHNAYDHKTWHGGDLPRVASTHKATLLHKAGLKKFVCLPSPDPGF